MSERFNQLWGRIESYVSTQPFQVFVELAIIWLVVYVIWRFLRGTRGARVIKGLAVILVAVVLINFISSGSKFERLDFLSSNFLTVVSLMLVIVFQPELRRALVRLGEANFFKQTGLRKARLIEEVLASVAYMSRNKIGALIAIERQVGLRGVVEAGTSLNAEISRELLQTIFWPGSALHDMGVVIRGDHIAAAGVQFPLAEGEKIPSELGSRHRAAIGLSQEADALVIVVSEETGIIGLAERGELRRGFTIDELRPVLTKELGKLNIDVVDDEIAAGVGGVESGGVEGKKKKVKEKKTEEGG
ncbi:DNA integrity scanning protein DisA [Poriferisphaera corsica]|uniref:Diadenylate cyclase n=1 Tax=Poriferisphaera corsica TaxID=2528020 RepID=A0A517YU26_9BACT|nr:diadenylate cyclase CdaA [Poriferisphaera corsica]QDU33733.1 DNA integrity scanning protein DisA [Poriferisphaera corsica]